ncbi:MAG: PAS domain S-box protein [Byssovorax sp.]
MNASAEVLQRLLARMPGVAWSARMNLATGQSSWMYVDSKLGEVYDVPEAEVLADPGCLTQRILPEDRARLDKVIAQSIQTLAPMIWSGRLQRRDGEIRWLETQTTIEIEADGSQLWSGQVLDVTERKRAEEALAASEAARTRSDALHQAVIEALPVGVMVMDPEGRFLIYNTAAERIAGRVPGNDDVPIADKFGVFKTDGVTPLPNEEVPIIRTLRGEDVRDVEVLLRNAYLEGERRLSVNGMPIRDESGKIIAGMVVVQDVTQQRALEREITTRNEQLAASEAAKTVLIERLRYSIDELSNPILEVWDDVLAMPIIGVVDSRRTADMVQRLLTEVARTQASFVIVDLTGVEIVDTSTADHLMKLIRKVELVGARCVLTGIRPAVAETLVDIGVDFGRITTLRNLKHGLREALRHAQRERDQRRSLDHHDEQDEGLQPRGR